MVADAAGPRGGQSRGAAGRAGLHVSFETPTGRCARSAVPRQRGTGQTLGIVGESGSGKSVSAQALLGLVPGAEVSGHAWFEGRDCWR